mmetsp:Transcript_1855/g.6401  ORF Transcript_1855/g.6401 Transcript_1855/m.6401 type:complete len:225 (+) Transcript_1855:60-734(+)
MPSITLPSTPLTPPLAPLGPTSAPASSPSSLPLPLPPRPGGSAAGSSLGPGCAPTGPGAGAASAAAASAAAPTAAALSVGRFCLRSSFSSLARARLSCSRSHSSLYCRSSSRTASRSQSASAWPTLALGNKNCREVSTASESTTGSARKSISAYLITYTPQSYELCCRGMPLAEKYGILVKSRSAPFLAFHSRESQLSTKSLTTARLCMLSESMCTRQGASGPA